MSDEFRSGMPVIITDALGKEYRTKALTGVKMKRRSFPVVWVERPMKDGSTEPAPWPLEAVRPA